MIGKNWKSFISVIGQKEKKIEGIYNDLFYFDIFLHFFLKTSFLGLWNDQFSSKNFGISLTILHFKVEKLANLVIKNLNIRKLSR